MNFYLLFGIVLLFTSIYLGFSNLRLGLLVLILLLPLTHKETLSLFSWDITAPRVFLVGLAVGGLLKAILKVFKDRALMGKWLRNLLQDRFFLLLFLLWIIRAASLSRSLNLEASFRLLSFFTAVLAFYLIFKACYAKYGEELLEDVKKVFLGGGVLITILALTQLILYLTRGTVFLGIWPVEGWLPCIGGTFWDINHFAVFVASLALIFWGRFFSSSGRNAVFNLLVSLYPVVILGLTLSQSGFSMFFVGFLVLSFFLLLRGYGKKLFPIYLVSFLVIVAILSFLATRNLNIRELYKLNFTPLNDSVAAHLYLAQGAVEIFKQKPILGGGYGSFNEWFRQTPYIKDYLGRDPIGEVRLPAHSIWLEALSETGLLGFLSLLALLLSPIIIGIKNIWGIKKEKIYIEKAVFLGTIFGIFTSGLVYSYNLLFFWFLIFLGLFLARGTASQDPNVRFWPAFKVWATRNRDSLAVCFLVVFSAIFILFGLGRNALTPWDEAIYAGVSKEMVKKSDFITPYWNGEEFFEKPPLFFWLQSISFFYLDFTAFAARLWPALFGIGGIVLVYLLGKKLFSRRVGFLSGAILATTIHWIAWSRVGMLDVPAATLILAAVYFFWRAWTEKKLKYWSLFGVFLGLTFMMKGPVAAIPIIVACSFLLLLAFISLSRCISGRPRNSKFQIPNSKHFGNLNFGNSCLFRISDFGFRIFIPLMLTICCFLLIVLPWHYAMFRCHGHSFIDEYFHYHMLERTSRGIEQHGRPFFWFNIVIRHWARHWYVLGLLSLVTLFGFLIRNLRKLGKFQAEFLVFLWATLTFLLFSLSSSKIQWYIIPIYPPLALGCGWFVSKVEEKFGNCLPRGILKKFFRGLLKIVNSAGLVGRLEFTTLATLFVIAVGITGLMLNQRKWFPEDLEQQVAYLSDRSRKLKDVGDTLYVADAPSPLPIFYSDKKVVTVDREGAWVAAISRGPVVLSKQGTYREILRKLEPTERRGLKVFEETEDYILYGRQ